MYKVWKGHRIVKSVEKNKVRWFYYLKSRHIIKTQESRYYVWA